MNVRTGYWHVAYAIQATDRSAPFPCVFPSSVFLIMIWPKSAIFQLQLTILRHRHTNFNHATWWEGVISTFGIMKSLHFTKIDVAKLGGQVRGRAEVRSENIGIFCIRRVLRMRCDDRCFTWPSWSFAVLRYAQIIGSNWVVTCITCVSYSGTTNLHRSTL